MRVSCSRCKLVAVCIALSLASNFQYGFSSTYLNTPVDSFKDYLNESLTAQHVHYTSTKADMLWDLLMDIWFVGFFFGIWMSPLLNDRFGRKIGFTVGNALSLLASVLRFLAIVLKVPELLFVGRVTASVVAAVTYQSLILYLQECSPTHLRGALSTLSEVSYSSMCVVGMLLGTSQIFGKRLPFLLGFPIVPCILAVLVLIPIPDTPKFLYITKNNRKAAIKALMFYQGENVDVQAVLSGFEKEQAEETKKSSLKEILTTPYLRKAVLLSCLALQNTVPLWAILLSSTDFLRRVNLENDISEWSSTVMTALYALGTLLGIFIVERFPRRLLIIGLSSTNNLTLIAYVIFESLQKVFDGAKYGCLVCFLFYGFTYGMGVGTLSWILSSELVPQQHRSLVQSLCYSVNTIMVVVSTFAVLPLYNRIHSFAFLVLYIVPSTISILYLYRNLPETSRREIYEIVADLKGKNGAKL